MLEQAGRLEVCVVRISETYGPGDRRLLKLFRAVKTGRFVLIGRCTNIHQPIFVDDLVAILLLAAGEAAAIGQILIASGQERLTTRELCATVAIAVGAPLRDVRLPLTPFLAAAVVLEKTLRPLGIQPPLHTRRLDFFRKSFAFSIDKVVEVLGYRPATDFATGATRTAEWYRDRALL